MQNKNSQQPSPQAPSVYSLEAVAKLPESRVVVIIHGGIYDVTEFLKLHPGGSERLKKFNRRDASKAFDANRHSIAAVKMLPDYCIGTLAGHEQEHKKHLEVLNSDKSHDTRATIKAAINKLVTHEDKFHLHKILGTLVLGHFAVRILILLAGTIIFLANGNSEVFHWNTQLDPAWLLIAMALVHGLLSLSSLQFAVPGTASQSKPMIHRMFRAHSICFALRAVFCMLFAVILQDDPAHRYLAITLVILVTLFIADYISDTLTDAGDRFDTTASMPYWFGISLQRQKVHKFFYAYAQFLATFVCLTAGYAGALYTLAPIQGAAFGMTLVRKNIISPQSYHNIYFALLFLPIPFVLFFFPLRVSFGLALTLFLFYLRSLGVNKYIIWTPVLLAYNILLVPDVYKKPFILGLGLCFLLAVIANLVYLKTRGSSRVDKNNRIISRRAVTDDAFEIIVRSKLPMTFLFGQHVLIRFHDHLSRKYTPIWTKHLEDSKQTLLCLRIKQYPLQGKQNASTYLATCPIDTTLDLYGPVGEKFYEQNTHSIIDHINSLSVDIKQHELYFLAAGSGITAIFQLAQAACLENTKCTLVTCDQAPDKMMMAAEIAELKHDFPSLLTWVSVFSANDGPFELSDRVINERLSPTILQTFINSQNNQSRLFVICGPDNWQEMISKSLKKYDQSFKLIIW